jgi:glycosyltransferase involved in cell wall biosynthesis
MTFFKIRVSRTRLGGTRILAHCHGGRSVNSRFYVDSYFQTQSEKSAESKSNFGNPLVHYAKHGRLENRITRAPNSDVAILTDTEREINSGIDVPLASRYTKLFEAIARPCKHLFLLGCLLRGGAERSACHCVRLAAEKAGNLEDVLVVVTDCSTITCADWLPVGTRVVNLAELQTKLTVNDKGSLIARLISATGADSVHIFNSPRAHAAVAYYFEHYPRPSSKIYSYLCGYEIYTDQNFAGFNDGALRLAAPHLDLIITDNNRLRETLKDRYNHIPSIETKAVTCYQPLTTALHKELSSGPGNQINRSERHKVVWASRIDPTKRPDILAKIAQCLPEVHFEVYGYSSSGYDFSFLRRLSNIKLMGEYSDFSQIPKDDKAVFLYTSDADGMPNVLLEAVASGLPIIAPDVGGIRELLTDNSGWLVRRFDDVDDYVRLLKHVLAYPEEANDRCRRAQALLKQRHSWSAFANRLADLGVV